MLLRRRSLSWLFGTVVLLGGVAPQAQAQEEEDKPALFDPYGDFRLRIEQDWDSRQTAFDVIIEHLVVRPQRTAQRR